MTNRLPISALRAAFGTHLQENVVLANYTTAHAGGPAGALVVTNTIDELANAVQTLWDAGTDFFVLGSGSNILVSDNGYPGVVVLNRARNIKIDTRTSPSPYGPNRAPTSAHLPARSPYAVCPAWSGLPACQERLAAQFTAMLALTAATCHANLVLAEILHRESGRETWPVERLDYAYRSSALKRQPGQSVILAARLHLAESSTEAVKARMEEFSDKRRASQPPGASMGSMFKNPAGDFAGRLIEAAGLKGTRVGAAEISSIHANFFINHGGATASDIYALIQKARTAVEKKFGVRLELEVELVGNWSAANLQGMG